MRVIVAIVIACAGCESVHRSTLLPYVRDLRVAPGGVEMIQCEIVYTRKTSQPLWTWLPFTPDHHVEKSLAPGECWHHVVPTTVAEGAP